MQNLVEDRRHPPDFDWLPIQGLQWFLDRPTVGPVQKPVQKLEEIETLPRNLGSVSLFLDFERVDRWSRVGVAVRIAR